MPIDPDRVQDQLARLDLIREWNGERWSDELEATYAKSRRLLCELEHEELVEVPLSRPEEEALILVEHLLDPYDGSWPEERKLAWELELALQPNVTVYLAAGDWAQARDDEEYAAMNVRPVDDEERRRHREYWQRDSWPVAARHVEGLERALQAARAEGWDEQSALLIGLPLDALLARARALLALRAALPVASSPVEALPSSDEGRHRLRPVRGR